MALGRFVAAILLLSSPCGQSFHVAPYVSPSTSRRGGSMFNRRASTARIFSVPDLSLAKGRCWAENFDVPDDVDASCDKISRREIFVAGGTWAALSMLPAVASESHGLVEISDPSTYSALAYTPPGAKGKLPLIVVLHGAGKNELDAWSLADPNGEHAGLAPSLLQTGRAPPELANNFALVAPYSAGKRSFYEEPRKKLLQFVEWACSDEGRAAGVPNVDSSKVFLFGFSDGATVGVELMTTGRFKAGVFAAYGFTGQLPNLALQRLKDLPIWIFHSADDVIFPVKCSDRLVSSPRRVQSRDIVRYTRYDTDQEGFTGDVKGHSTGITSSKNPAIYSWMLAIAREGEDVDETGDEDAEEADDDSAE